MRSFRRSPPRCPTSGPIPRLTGGRTQSSGPTGVVGSGHAAVLRRPAHPLEVLAGLQPGPATWSTWRWWARRKGITRARAPATSPTPAWFDQPARDPRAGRAGPVPAARGAGRADVAARLPPSVPRRRCGSCSRWRSPRSTSGTTAPARCTTWSTCPTSTRRRRSTRGPRRGSATWPPTAGRSSAWTRATCWRSPWRRARRLPGAGAHLDAVVLARSAPSPASTRSRTATPTWPTTSSRSRPGCPADPEMNWRVSSLDRYRLVSATPTRTRRPALGREATVFDADLDYFAIRRALETGDGLDGTVEFFPEEGKYHARRPPQVRRRWTPAETRGATAAVPGVRQAAHRRGAAPGRGAGRPPGGRTGRPARPGSATSSSCPRSSARSSASARGARRSTAAARPAWSPRSARSWTSSSGVPLDEIAGPAASPGRRGHRPAAPRRRPPRRPATTASTARSGSSSPASSAAARRPRPLFEPDPPATPLPRPNRARPTHSRGPAVPAVPAEPGHAEPPPDRPPTAGPAPERSPATSRSSRCSPAWRRSAPGLLDRLDARAAGRRRRRAGRC